MNCEEAMRRFQESLDGAPLPESAERHFGECEGCRAAREALARADRMLGEDEMLTWRPELTARVMDGVRRRRRAARWSALAAAALILAAGWLGAQALLDVPAVREAGTAVADRLPLPDSPMALLEDVGDDFADLAGVRFDSPVSLGPAVAIFAVLGLLFLNGAVLGGPILAGRRQS